MKGLIKFAVVFVVVVKIVLVIVPMVDQYLGCIVCL